MTVLNDQWLYSSKAFAFEIARVLAVVRFRVYCRTGAILTS